MSTIEGGIAAVNAHHFKKAYAFVSKPLQNQVSFGDFHDVIRRVKSVHLISVKVIRQTSQLAEARITAEGLEEDREEKEWKKRKVTVTAVFVPENGVWKVIQVDFKTKYKN